LPERSVVPLWAALNICLAIAAGYVAVRLVAPDATISEIATVTLLFLCWSGTKSFLQFTLVGTLAGLCAVWLADTRVHWSALCLAFAATKPQIAAPFVLWFLFAGRWTTAFESLLFVVGAALLFCLRAHANPMAVGIRYVEILRAIYTGTYQMVGTSNVRPLLAAMLSPSLADIAAALTGLLLLAAICFVAIAHRKERDAALYAGLAMGAVWSLVTFYHLTYGFVLLLPTSALLFAGDRGRSERLPRLTFWALQAALIVDVPGVWRRLGPFFPRSGIDALFAHADRLLGLLLLTVLFVIFVRARGAVARPNTARSVS
jgi:hypothetical protein